jgi:mono/diheme cytochrome c family protein
VKALPLLLLFAAAPLNAQSGAALANPRDTPADREAGARIFHTHCAPCHGIKGTGGTGPDLTTGRFFHGSTDADLYRNISEGIPNTAMPDVFFDGAQVWQIVAYVRSLSQQASPRGKGRPRAWAPAHRETKAALVLPSDSRRGRFQGAGPFGDRFAARARLSARVDRRSFAHIAPEYRVARISVQGNVLRAGFLLNQDTYMVQILDFKKGLMSDPAHFD